MQTKKILITGGAGFIGSHTVEELLDNGYEVTVLDSLRTGDLQNISHVQDRIKFVEGDIRDEKLLDSLIDADTAIVNLAAVISIPESIENPQLAHDINVNGTHTLLVKIKEKNAKCFVSASSAAIYGLKAPVPTPETAPHDPLSPYGLHKSINEQYGKLYAELYGISCIFLRFFNVYGPRQKSEGGYPSVIPAFKKKILAGVSAQINGPGTISRDFIHVKDIARALRLAVELQQFDDTGNTTNGTTSSVTSTAPVSTKFAVFNIATGKPTTLDTLWSTMCEIKGLDLTPTYGEMRIGDIETSYADITHTKEKLGFEAQIGIEEGLKSIFE